MHFRYIVDCLCVSSPNCFLSLASCYLLFLVTCFLFLLLVFPFYLLFLFSARCNIYISRLCYDVNVCLSVHLSVTEVHWCIIANLVSNSDPNLPRIVVAGRGNPNNNILRYASHC